MKSYDDLKSKVTKQYLIDEYVVKGIKLSVLADKNDTTADVMKQYKNEYGLSASAESRKSARIERVKSLNLTKEKLKSLYDEGYTDRELAKKYGFNRSGMDYILYTYYEIPHRSKAKSKSIRVNHIKKTNLERYGTENTFNAFRSKSLHKLREEYNDDSITSPFGIPEIQRKSKETLMNNYGVSHNHKSPEVVKKDLDTKMKRYHKKYISCEKYNINGLVVYSKLEYDVLKSLSTKLDISSNNVKTEKRYHHPGLNSKFELDLIYNDHYAIEVNDTSSHHSNTDRLIRPKSPSYHMEKSKDAAKLNFFLLHWYEILDNKFDYLTYFSKIVNTSNSDDLIKLLMSYNILVYDNETKLYILDLSFYNLLLPSDKFKLIGYRDPKNISTKSSYIIYNAGYAIYQLSQASSF